jgi:hypothetical protein
MSACVPWQYHHFPFFFHGSSESIYLSRIYSDPGPGKKVNPVCHTGSSIDQSPCKQVPRFIACLVGTLIQTLGRLIEFPRILPLPSLVNLSDIPGLNRTGPTIAVLVLLMHQKVVQHAGHYEFPVLLRRAWNLDTGYTPDILLYSDRQNVLNPIPFYEKHALSTCFLLQRRSSSLRQLLGW